MLLSCDRSSCSPVSAAMNACSKRNVLFATSGRSHGLNRLTRERRCPITRNDSREIFASTSRLISADHHSAGWSPSRSRGNCHRAASSSSVAADRHEVSRHRFARCGPSPEHCRTDCFTRRRSYCHSSRAGSVQRPMRTFGFSARCSQRRRARSFDGRRTLFSRGAASWSYRCRSITSTAIAIGSFPFVAFNLIE